MSELVVKPLAPRLMPATYLVHARREGPGVNATAVRVLLRLGRALAELGAPTTHTRARAHTHTHPCSNCH